MAKEKNEKKVKTDNKSFMKDFKAELKRVVWPTSKQMVSNVTAVIVIVVVTAAIVFCLDLVFGAMNDYGINKLKTHIQSSNQEQVQTIENGTSNPTNNETQNPDIQNNVTVENQENQNSNVVVENTVE